MAKTRELKDQMMAQYDNWLKRSQALIVTEYTGLNMNDMDALRAKIREAGGEFHIVKNTLSRQTWEKAGVKIPSDLLEGSTAVAFAFKDAPAVAKALLDFAKSNEKVKIKGGVLDLKAVSAQGVKSLADLPPLPVVRAQLLGTLLAPASKMVRTLAEPGRQVAAVIKAFSDRESASAAA